MKANNLNKQVSHTIADPNRRQTIWHSEYSQAKLQDLICNETKFLNTILELQKLALTQSAKGQFEKALDYLMDAEKILEYGANCGKIIDRKLIISILHNEAFCYQRMGDKLRSSKYIQAINFNLRSHVKSLESTSSQTSIFHPNFVQTIKNIASPQILLTKKLQLANLSSQLGNRKEALISAKIAIKLYQQYFKGILVKNKIKEELNVDSKTIIYEAVKFCSEFKTEPDPKKVGQYINIAKYAIKKWEKNLRKTERFMADLFKGYSIGKLVDLSESSYQHKNTSPKPIEITSLSKQICHFAMAHFQIGTEYRLINDKEYKNSSQDKQKTQQYHLSMIFHLLSIIIIGLHFPTQILFMRQVIGSFQFHYKKKLFLMEQPEISVRQLNFELICHVNEEIEEEKREKKKIRLESSRAEEKHNKDKNKNKKMRTRIKSMQHKIENKMGKLKIKNRKQKDGKKNKNQYFVNNQNHRKNKGKIKNVEKTKKFSKHSKKQSYYFNNQKQLCSPRHSKSIRSKRIFTSVNSHTQSYAHIHKNSTPHSPSSNFGHTYGHTSNSSKVDHGSSRSSRFHSHDNNLIKSDIKKSIKEKNHKKINTQTKQVKQKNLAIEIHKNSSSPKQIIFRQQAQISKRHEYIPSKARYIAINNYYI